MIAGTHMSNAHIEMLPIWCKVCFQIDAGNSVLLSIPRFCGENRILQRLCDVYGTSHKHGAVLARVGRKPTTGEIDFGTLWDDVRSGLGLPKDVMASTEMEFHASLAEQVKKRKARLLLILSGVEPGMEARVFSLMKELHALHKRYRLATPPRFQFVVADQFLIELYTNKMGIDWSELFTVKRETNRPFTRAELREYLAGVSPHKNSSTENDHLADRLMDCTGGHLGLVTELCDTLQRTGWPSTAEVWDRTISPTLTDTKVLESLRAAISDDKTGLARTALDFVEPNYAVEYDSPRFSHLRRLGVLHRHSESQLVLIGGSIRSLMEGMARNSTSEDRVGTVLGESGMSMFLEECYVPDPDDFVVVHVSDVHIGPDHGFRLSFSGKTINAESSKLSGLLRRDLEGLGLLGRVDSLVISGDLVCRGVHDEFCRASEVLQELLKDLNLSKDQLMLVPGNHDVQWDPGEFSPTVPGNRQLSRDGYDMLLKLLGKNPQTSFEQIIITSKGGHRRLRIAGFDSNYVEGPNTAGIGFVSKEALDAAGQVLDADLHVTAMPTLTWFVVHHHVLPVCDVSISDAQGRRISVMGNASQILSTARAWGVESVLHGHQHQPAVSYAQRWIGESGPSKFSPILIVGAGSCGAKRERLGPIAYNHYFVLARQKNSMLVRSRTIRSDALSFSAHEDLLIQMPS